MIEYTKEQREQIKKAFTAEDRKKLKAAYQDSRARQYCNGLKRVSSYRAKEIADIIGKPGIIKVLLPELFSKKSA